MLVLKGSERLFVRSLDAGAIGFLLRETVRVLSDVDLVDVM